MSSGKILIGNAAGLVDNGTFFSKKGKKESKGYKQEFICLLHEAKIAESLIKLFQIDTKKRMS
jgi:hypothetical protein